jgi:homopolymeric O-antigen transport system permease protein
MTTSASEGMSLTSSPFPLPHRELPDKPLVVVQPSRSWSLFDFKELWSHRELLYFLTWRDLKVRYKQTIFGVSWVVLQPIMMTAIFTLFLGRLVRVPSGDTPYSLLVFSGLLPWTFFSTSILGAAQSLVINSSLITKVYFPRVLIPASNVVGRLVDFVISVLVFIALMIYFAVMRGYQINLTSKLLLVPVVVVLLFGLTLAFAILVSCLNVRYRDIGIALPVIIQLWMFVSPVVYSKAVVPEHWQKLYSLNPLVGLIEGFRASLFGTPIPWFGLSITIAITVVLLIVASMVFRQTEKTFADIV